MKATSRSLKELALLTLPVLALVALGFFSLDSGQAPVVERTLVTRGPCGSEGLCHTTVNVLVRYHAPSLYKRFREGPSWNIANETVVDESGKKVKVNYGRWVFYQGDQLYAISYQLPLDPVPQSRGRLTLKAVATIDKKWVIPISVIVREKDNH